MADIEITGYGPSADLADNIGGKNARFKEGHIQTLVDGDTAINTADIASKDIATAETNGLMSATDKVTLDAVETAAKAVSNPNILINTDFRNQYLINQRGVTEMTTNIYGPDRWRTVSGSASVSAAENGATRFTSVSGSGYVAQYLENPNRFIGKTITISCKSRVSTAAQVPSLILYLAGVGQVALTRSADWNVSSGSITVPSSVSNITTAQVYWQYNGVGSWIELEWIKLEEGSVATPWQVPDPAGRSPRGSVS